MDADTPGDKSQVKVETPGTHWLLVMCLIGVDYFSSLAYQPSITFEVAGPLGPLATIGVVLVTLLAAVPVYYHLASRSPGGLGSIALLERLVHGWRGKTLVLVLLGFAATDFLMTRTLSVADAAEHLTHNEYEPWRQGLADFTRIVRAGLSRIDARAAFLAFDPLVLVGILAAGAVGLFLAAAARGRLRAIIAVLAGICLGAVGLLMVGDWLLSATLERLDEQVLITILLSLLAFLLWAVILRRGFNTDTTRVAAWLVGGYLLVNALVIGSGLVHLARHPTLLQRWYDSLGGINAPASSTDLGALVLLFLMSLRFFPQLSLGLSGYEFSLLVMPQVHGDGPSRVRNTRRALVLAAIIMCVYLLAAVVVTTTLIPPEEFAEDGRATHRALSYLAHGSRLNDAEGTSINPLFGPHFGTIYDIATVLILSLAGISVVMILESILPRFLHRFGMDLDWVDRWKLLFRVFLIINIVTTVVFHASVSDQRGAYATGVLALFTNASALTVVDRWRERPQGGVGSLTWWGLGLGYYALVAIGFLAAMLYVMVTTPSGLVIAVLFTVAILGLAVFSRAVRAGELRTGRFEFADEESRLLWDTMRDGDFPVLIPHRPGRHARDQKEASIRADHNLDPDLELLFLEIHLDDPSNFQQVPFVKVFREGKRFVIHVTRCASIPHTVAAVALEFSRGAGKPPGVHFGWSERGLLEAVWSFLVFGEGNVPEVVRELLVRAEPEELRRPRVIVG